MLISLTFDDGFKQHYKVALKLYRMDIPATFFIITGLKKYNGKHLLINEPKLLKEIHNLNHEIASHTHTHRDLTKLDEAKIMYECQYSKSILENVINDEVKGFAYPYSIINDNVVRTVKKFYKYARCMGKVNRWNNNLHPYKIGSIGIRHLPKLFLKITTLKKPKLVVITFHEESTNIVTSIARLLKELGFELKTLYEALTKLNALNPYEETYS